MLFVQLSSKVLAYKRKAYNVLDFIGDMGGFIEMMIYLVKILVSGYGTAQFKVFMLFSAFRRRD